MPELPEVEVVRRGLLPLVTGKTIQTVEVLDSKFIVPTDRLVGKVIEDIDRKGKFLFFRLSEKAVLLIHLGMTGTLVFEEAGKEHLHHRLAIGFGGHELNYLDQRRFGKIRYLDEPSWRSLWHRIGVDPLSQEYEFSYLQSVFRNRSCRIKDLLLDQRGISGIGNIYACEILFRAGIHPEKRVNRLSLAEVELIYRTVPQVLEEAIALRGTTIRNFRRSDGQEGEFQNRLGVYGRAELPCPVCGQKIERVRFSNRSSFMCPRCQKA